MGGFSSEKFQPKNFFYSFFFGIFFSLKSIFLIKIEKFKGKALSKFFREK